MSKYSPTMQDIPLDIVGSSTFGRDPKIMASRTFNMISADDWLIDLYGYNVAVKLSENDTGRGIFSSVIGNGLVAVAGNTVYAIKIFAENSSATKKVYKIYQVGEIDSFSGDVFMDENNANQIAICDQNSLYIYNYVTGDFQKANLPEGVVPGYVTYQNGRFVIPNKALPSWYLSAPGNGLNWFWDPSGNPVFGGFQTKPNLPVAALRFPGKGNLLFVMGSTVTEPWTDLSLALFPYQKSTTLNFDYGCLNPATISTEDEIVAWIGANEKSGPVLMYSTGGNVQQISTDGINYQLSRLNYPQKCSAFFVKLSGHLLYQFTFYDPSDNVSLIYDFTTSKFFDVTDENMNYHIARRAAFFDNDYYFISFRDGNLYQMNASSSTFDYRTSSNDSNDKIYDIPRIRITSNVRQPDSTRVVVNKISFIMEQGNDENNNDNDPRYDPRIACSISIDGGITYSSYVDNPIYKVGRRPNKLDWWQCGSANDFVSQYRFHGKGPWKCTNGVTSIYQ